MDHPQSVLLGRVVQSNISLGDAYVNNSERPKLVPRWTYLQQAVNVLFDSKTATSESLYFSFSMLMCCLIAKRPPVSLFIFLFLCSSAMLL